MSVSAYSAIPFADVRITGPFWRERLETVLEHTIPSQHAKLKEVGILDSLKLPKPVPPPAPHLSLCPIIYGLIVRQARCRCGLPSLRVSAPGRTMSI
jgi:hypothetical protein